MPEAITDPNVLLKVEGLHVEFRGSGDVIKAAQNIGFTLRQGETLGIVGESGSGKSVTALSIMHLLQSPPAFITQGKIWFKSRGYGTVDLNHTPAKTLRHIRGNEISMIFQEPMTSLNPVYTCGNQVAETLMVHKKLRKDQARENTIDLFREVQLPRPEKIYDIYPHEISGGQKQRVMIAMAMACNPAILIADEPTTALDVTVQANMLRTMEKLREDHNTSIIFITHDLAVVAEIADRVLVMHDGEIVERGSVFDIFTNPQHPYTKGLLACRPRMDVKLKKLLTISDFMKTVPSDMQAGEITPNPYGSIGQAILLNAETLDETIEKRLRVIKRKPLLRIRNLSAYFPVRKGIFGKVTDYIKAVQDVSFDVYPGETVGLVGESGCGKTTLGRTIIRLIDPTEGEIIFDDREIHNLRGEGLRQLRKEMQIIFQDPYSSLNPRHTIGQAIMEPMRIHNILGDKNARKSRAIELLETVGLQANYFYRFPHEFSGGQRQRACIARALALNPKFIICDESVSALDVSVQAQVLNLLNSLKDEFKFTYIFISHDLSVIRFMADRILVMNNGRLVEMGYPEALFDRPKEEYTRQLINAIPKGDVEDIRKSQLRRRLAYAKKSLF